MTDDAEKHPVQVAWLTQERDAARRHLALAVAKLAAITGRPESIVHIEIMQESNAKERARNGKQ